MTPAARNQAVIELLDDLLESLERRPVPRKSDQALFCTTPLRWVV